jgi:hypothetical protein
MVYVGPSVRGLCTRTILGKARPDFVKRLVAECPAVERFIVPLSMMAQSERAIASVGSQAYFDAQDVVRKLG